MTLNATDMQPRPRQHATSQWAVQALIVCILLALTSPLAAEGLKVFSSTQTFGPYQLDEERLQQMPAGFVPIQFEDPVWVVGYSAEIINSEGKALSNDLHCHTMLTSPITEKWQEHQLNGRPFKGLYTDGFTRRIVLPKGFGLFIDGGESLELQPMFNNRGDSEISAAMAVTAHFVHDKDLTEPLTPLFSTVAVVADPHLYMVAPGEDVREREFRIPYAGVIHAMGVHIHPYGREIKLINKSRGETVWSSVGTVGADGQLIEMPFYSNTEGYPFSPEDRFAIRAKYFNTTDVEQDAMAGLFIFFATEDGKLP